jgi:hypothetical protein
MLPHVNEEETRKIRRAEDQSECISDTNLDRKLRPNIESNERQSFRTDRDDGERRKQPRNFDGGKTPSGKIVAHLINECRDQIEANKKENIDLESKIQRLEILKSNLEEGIQE